MSGTRPNATPTLPLDVRSRLLVLTGAGISADSGLATFRGAGGLWAGQRVEDVATPEAFARDPAFVWRFYSERRAAAAAAEPNAAHLALAALERRLGERFLLATQNVDGLHGRAGTERLVELHGSLWRVRCSTCDAPPLPDDGFPVEPPLPECSACAARGRRSYLRPDIVWFGEPLDPDDDWRVHRFIRASERAASTAGERLVFLAIGTSGTVWPVAGLVRHAADFGAETWLVNLDPGAQEGAFEHVVHGRAAEVVPALLESLDPPTG
jgi:NAD-dependent deacetylase